MLQALLLTIGVSFGGTSVQCAVDTGSAVTVLSRSQAERVTSKQPLAATSPLQGVGGQPISAALFAVSRVTAGELSWTDATVAVLPDEALGATGCLLGMDLLGRQPVVLDWQAKRILAFRAGTTLTAGESAPVMYVTIASDAEGPIDGGAPEGSSADGADGADGAAD